MRSFTSSNQRHNTARRTRENDPLDGRASNSYFSPLIFFIAFRGSHILLSVGVALLAKHEEEIESMNDLADIFTRLQTIGKEVNTIL